MLSASGVRFAKTSSLIFQTKPSWCIWSWHLQGQIFALCIISKWNWISCSKCSFHIDCRGYTISRGSGSPQQPWDGFSQLWHLNAVCPEVCPALGARAALQWVPWFALLEQYPLPGVNTGTAGKVSPPGEHRGVALCDHHLHQRHRTIQGTFSHFSLSCNPTAPSPSAFLVGRSSSWSWHTTWFLIRTCKADCFLLISVSSRL